MTRNDYRYYDYIIAMDHNNLRNLKWMFGEDTEHKISRLMDYTYRPCDVADPLYTGDFEALNGMFWKDAGVVVEYQEAIILHSVVFVQ